MRTVAALIFLLGVVNSFGQLGGIENYKSADKSLLKGKSFQSLPDSIKRMLVPKNNDLAIRQDERNDMPVLKQKLYGEYLTNNGNGSDIYKMKPYNMPCLVPDSGFKSNMPVRGSEMVQSPQVELRKNRMPDAPKN